MSVILFYHCYICVGFGLLDHLTCDLSQAEKKINAVTSWATDNYDHSKWQLQPFWVKFVAKVIFFSAWDKSCVKWTNRQKPTQMERIIRRGFLQRQKRSVICFVKKFVTELSDENKLTLYFQRIGILIHVLSWRQ